MTFTLREFRDLHADLKLVEVELADIGEELKTHPDKPEHGSPPSKQWNRAAAPLLKKRKILRQERGELVRQIEAMKAELDQRPLALQSLSSMIDSLVEIEATFDERGADHARAKLEAFLDYLEGEEQRVSKLVQEVKAAS